MHQVMDTAVNSVTHSTANTPFCLRPDKGELGSLPTHRWHRFRTCSAGVFFLCGVGLLLYLLAGVCPYSYVSSVAGWMVGFFFFGHSFLRLMPLLLEQPGRITYVRVDHIQQCLLPSTAKSRLCLGLLLADIVILPMCIGLSVFRERLLSAILSIVLYPPPIPSSVLFFLLFWILPIVWIAAHVVHALGLSMERTDPYFFVSRPTHKRLCGIAVWVIAGLMIPSCTYLLSALPCDPVKLSNSSGAVVSEEYFMRYASHTRCLSKAHKAHIFFACFFFMLLQIFMDVAIGTLLRLKEPHAADHVDEPKNDALFLEVLRFIRIWTVILMTSEPHTINCFFVFLVTLLPQCWLHLGRFASSVECMQEGYKLSLGALAIESLLAAGIKLIIGVNLWGCLAWWILWLAFSVVVLYRFHNQFGFGFVSA